jgi:hypothetical protein
VPSSQAPRPVDHFECYTLDHPPRPTPRLVYTQDQFDHALVPTKIGLLYRFCNPVQKVFGKRTTKIRNTAMHLTLYTIQVGVTPARTIVVSNQFGSGQTLTIGRASWIALPSSKNVETPPPARVLSHFKCYPVTAAQQRAEIPVTLEDQWQRVPGGVIRARIFCNPSLKYVRGPPARRDVIVDRATHLVCYGLKAGFVSRSLVATNQFGSVQLTVVRPDLLCVPSKKLSVNP